MSANSAAEVEKDCQKVLMELTSKKWDHLVMLWKIFGHSEETLEKRKQSVVKHVQELYLDMIKEEESRVQEKANEVAKLRSVLDLLASQLEQPAPKIENVSLLFDQSVVMAKIEELTKLKAKKMEKWVALRELESIICKEIGEDVSDDVEGIPSEQMVGALKVLIDNLKDDKKQRIGKYLVLKASVAENMTLLEKVPESELEKTLLGSTTPVLSLEFLKKSGQLLDELTSQVNENKEAVDRLWVQIKHLWVCVDIPKEIQNEFELSHPGSKPTVLAKIQAEHKRLEEIKMANLSKYIERLSSEILSLCNTVYKQIELPAVTDTEECLEEYENLMKSLQSYELEHHETIDKFNKRNLMWQQWKESEARAEDPSRLMNRGGALLREEKTRQALQKKLPRIEKEIEDSSNGFEIYGVDVVEYMRRETEEHNRDKEDRKAEKKKKTTNNDKTVMNATRKRPAPATPAAAGAASGKRNKLMPVNKVLATPRSGLRGHLISPARTYSDFTNHRQIFQSTLNNGVQESTGKKADQTPRKGEAPTPTPTAGRKLYMTPTIMHL